MHTDGKERKWEHTGWLVWPPHLAPCTASERKASALKLPAIRSIESEDAYDSFCANTADGRGGGRHLE